MTQLLKMSNKRLVQHREKREANSRELSELKKENERLKRQIARMRKQIDKLGEPEEVEVIETPKETPRCPKCSSVNLGAVTLPNGKVITACKSCKKWRSKPL